ncbi:MAG: 50S ribosomal protein L15 [Patescibacteria group bacterium]|nr:50S ribosomal protein L15 [Patescibacteria group bacterium]
MKLYELKPAKGSTKKRKIVGRGIGSGHGIFSGRGCKGQKARSGYSRRPSFEGGRTPLYMQIPKKRGFKSLSDKYEIVNVLTLEKDFKDNDTIDKKVMFEVGLIKSAKRKVKILGDGDIKKKLNVVADYFSKSAKEKIEKAGGSIKIIEIVKKEKATDNKKNPVVKVQKIAKTSK